MIYHGIHVAGINPEKQIRSAENREGILGMPVRLGNHSDPEAEGLQISANNGSTKARMIDIGISGNNNDVTAVPPQTIHLLSAHRQKRSRYMIFPELRIGTDITAMIFFKILKVIIGNSFFRSRRHRNPLKR